jgi:RNA polymerase sigma-70 factor (ECF subfamily)
MELLEEFGLGSLEAFETLFRQYQGEVYSWVVRIVRDPGIAEDLTVETFWRIYRARNRFDPDREFGAWARRIATNAALDHLRGARREVPLAPNGPEPQARDSQVEPDVRDAIQQAFRALPARLRAVATLALVEEAPHADIAEALGISVGAVKSRTFRAVRLLRKRLRQMGMEP